MQHVMQWPIVTVKQPEDFCYCTDFYNFLVVGGERFCKINRFIECRYLIQRGGVLRKKIPSMRRCGYFLETLYKFIQINNQQNALPIAIRSEVELVSVNKRLNFFLFYYRLSSVFNQDDIHSYKLVCPTCCHANTIIPVHCSC